MDSNAATHLSSATTSAVGRSRVRLDAGTQDAIEAIDFLTGTPPGQVRRAVPRAAPAGEQPEPRERHALDRVVAGPLGIDIGSASMVVAGTNGGSMVSHRQSNAFFAVPASKMTRKSLRQSGALFLETPQELFVIGTPAEDLARMHGCEVRRPIAGGLLNPREEHAAAVLRTLIDALIPKAPAAGETACFSVPAESRDNPMSTVFHRTVIATHLQSLGYRPLAVTGGLSVVLSELADARYTGIGVCIGSGICEICLSYLAVPVIEYSLDTGGDFIDRMVSRAVGEPLEQVRAYKETEMHLAREPRTRIETGLQIFYADLFSRIIESIRQVLGTSDKIPRIASGIPLILSGGATAGPGTLELFRRTCEGADLPVPVSEIRIAEQPLLATACGSLRMAVEEAGE